MELSEDEQGDYRAAKQNKMIERMVPANFVWMDFLSADFDRKKHYFCTQTVTGQSDAWSQCDCSFAAIPTCTSMLGRTVSRQLRAVGDLQELDTALER